MKIGIIGNGYVGQGMARMFGDKFDLIIRDIKDPNAATQAEINDCDLAVICVPTPMSEDGSVNLTYIESVFNWLETPLIMIKSTVPPGTTAILEKKHPTTKIVFSPEYMGEGGYYIPQGMPDTKDPRKTDFHIIGGKPWACEAIMPFIQKAVGPHARYAQTDSTTAELCKYMENAWIGTKVAFVNEFYALAQRFDVDYTELRELWLLDGRINRSHTLVYPDQRGYSGKCIPKDMAGIIAASGGEARLLEAVHRINKERLGD